MLLSKLTDAVKIKQGVDNIVELHPRQLGEELVSTLDKVEGFQSEEKKYLKRPDALQITAACFRSITRISSQFKEILARALWKG